MNIMSSLMLLPLFGILAFFGFTLVFEALDTRFSSYGIASLISLLERLLNFKARWFINALLHVAVRRSHPLIVEFLLRLEADCASRNTNRDTALLAAIRKNDQQHLLEIARLLLPKSNPMDYDRDGNTAYHLAVGLVDRYDIFKELLNYIADFEEMNSSGETVLHLAVKCGNLKAIEC